MDRDTKRAWDVYFKNASVGAYAVRCILKKAKKPELCAVLAAQYRAYSTQERQARAYYRKTGQRPPADAAIAKHWTGMGIRLRTLHDRSASNLAKLTVEGVNMGVITLLQMLHDIGNVPASVIRCGNAILRRENLFLERLKEHL